MENNKEKKLLLINLKRLETSKGPKENASLINYLRMLIFFFLEKSGWMKKILSIHISFSISILNFNASNCMRTFFLY